jgi:hypothetical protein
MPPRQHRYPPQKPHARLPLSLPLLLLLLLLLVLWLPLRAVVL